MTAYGTHAAKTAPLATFGILALAGAALCAGAFLYGFFALLRNTYVNGANIRDERLDERWAARRNRAVVLAFRFVAIGLCCVALYSEAAFSLPAWNWLRDPYAISWLAWLGALLGMTLPTAIMAWTEPDPLVD